MSGSLIGLVRVRIDRREGKTGDGKQIGPSMYYFVPWLVTTSPDRTSESEDETDRRAECKI